MFSITLAIASTASAHNSPWPRATVTMDANNDIRITLRCDVTAYVMQTATGHLPDDLAGQMESMTADEFQGEIERRQRVFASSMLISADGRYIDAAIAFPSAEVIRKVKQAPGGPVETIQSVITVTGRVPNGARRITLSFPAEIGSIILMAGEGDAATVEVLPAGQLCIPITVTALQSQDVTPSDTTETAGTPDNSRKKEDDPDHESLAGPTSDVPREVITAGNFAALGFWHIVPEGLDHILFVLGLFLLSTQMKPLLWQVSAFTIAHSLTLALAIFEVVRVPPSIVEPLIAASIAYVAIENIFTTELKPWRPAIVFLFGLLHGLGFAGVLGELGLPRGQYVPALVGFNIGVEFGQLAVIAAALLTIGWFRHAKAYRNVVVIPGSLAIGAIGIYWMVERIFFGG